MKFVVILKSGKVMVFSVKACAELYALAYMGAMVTETACAEVFA